MRQSSDIIEAVRLFVSARGHPAIIYFLNPDEPIGTPNVREVAECIGDGRYDELDLVIDSVGGDIHAAYQLVSFLRLHTKKLIACVPRYARSAATLLCVGADLILLDELAALGPLDAQVYEGATEGGQRYGSALNPFKALERLRDFSLETLQDAAELLYDAGVHRTEDVLKHAMEFVRATTGPLFEKIESHRLGEFGQALAIGEEYGRRLLARTAPTLSEESREQILRRLVHEYPSHEYVIDHLELRDLGMQVELLSGEGRIAAQALARHADERAIILVDPEAPATLDMKSRKSVSTQGDVETSAKQLESLTSESDGAAVQVSAQSVPGATETSFGREGGLQHSARPNPWRRRNRG